jgi:voltage-gated potassium channel
MENRISALKNHIIVCGGGRTGRHIVIEFYRMHTPFVVIEQNSDVLDDLLHIGDILYIQDDATQDETLIEAGIERAKGVVAAIGDDKDNVFIVLSARSLNPQLHIVARANEEVNEEKLRKAGADKIVSPNAIGGLRMASLIIRPHMVSYLDEIMRVTGNTIRFDEVQVDDVPFLIDKTLAQAHIGRRTGLLIVAIRSRDGNHIFNPGGATILKQGDTLVVLGTEAQILKLYDSLEQSPPHTSFAEVIRQIEEDHC